jgi:cytochrome bd-type quinol oxidase subunit 2
MYPYLIRPYPGAAGGLTIFQASPPTATLALTLLISSVGLAAVIVYSAFVRRRMALKVTVHDDRSV